MTAKLQFGGLTAADLQLPAAAKAVTDGVADTLGLSRDAVTIDSISEVTIADGAGGRRRRSRRHRRLHRTLLATALDITFRIEAPQAQVEQASQTLAVASSGSTAGTATAAQITSSIRTNLQAAVPSQDFTALQATVTDTTAVVPVTSPTLDTAAGTSSTPSSQGDSGDSGGGSGAAIGGAAGGGVFVVILGVSFLLWRRRRRHRRRDSDKDLEGGRAVQIIPVDSTGSSKGKGGQANKTGPKLDRDKNAIQARKRAVSANFDEAAEGSDDNRTSRIRAHSSSRSLPPAVAMLQIKTSDNLRFDPEDDTVDVSDRHGRKTIGAGGFGIVLKCTFKGQSAAYKEFVPAGAAAGLTDTMVKEIEIMVSLPPHRNVMNILAVGAKRRQRDSQDKPFGFGYLMRFADKGSVRKILDNMFEDLPWERRTSILQQACAGLAHLHSNNVFHGDIKADNMLVFIIGTGWMVKISDFGVSKIKQTTTGGANTTGGTRGTDLWHSPERYQDGKGYRASDDVFSFAMVVLELASRKEPWDGLTREQVIGFLSKRFEVSERLRKRGISEKEQHEDWLAEYPLEKRRPSLDVIEEGCPEIFKKAMQRCWVDDPNERPSFQDLIEDSFPAPAASPADLDEEIDDAAAGGMSESKKKDWSDHFDERQQLCAKEYNGFLPPSLEPGTKQLQIELLELEAANIFAALTDVDRGRLEELLKEVRKHIETKKESALPMLEKIVVLRDELGGEYLDLYESVERFIKKKEKASRDDAMEVYEAAQAAHPGPAGGLSQPAGSSISELYVSAVKTKPAFDRYVSRVANNAKVKGEFKAGPLKHIFRTLEKTLMKPKGDPTLGQCGDVADIVRAMIVCKEHACLKEAIKIILADHGKAVVKILRIKDRFGKLKTAGGWSDVVINLIICSADGSEHICEIQLVHQKLLAVRKEMGGHLVYSVYRTANELTEVHGDTVAAAVEQKQEANV